MTVAAIVAAAGRGTRLAAGTAGGTGAVGASAAAHAAAAADVPKALRELAGVPLLVHAVRALAAAAPVARIVVVAPPADVAEVTALLPADLPVELVVIAGGDTRRQSVALGMEALDPDVDVVLVHDGARPLAPTELVERVAAAVLGGAEAVVPGVPVADTVKRVTADGVVAQTLDRTALRAVQTPQGFRRSVLAAAHAACPDVDEDAVTDDAALVEMLGRPVRVVTGSEEAFKVTRSIDLVLAEALLARRRAGHVR